MIKPYRDTVSKCENFETILYNFHFEAILYHFHAIFLQTRWEFFLLTVKVS